MSPMTNAMANSGMDTFDHWSLIKLLTMYAMSTVNAMKPACSASGSMDEGLVVALPMEGRSSSL